MISTFNLIARTAKDDKLRIEGSEVTGAIGVVSEGIAQHVELCRIKSEAVVPEHLDTSNILAWIPVGIFVTRYVYSVATVTGTSMQPAFNPDLQKNPLQKDYVLLERWSSYRLKRIKRGDVVTIWSPTDPNMLTTKRVVALEGDVVQPLPPHSPLPVRIQPGFCWVEGDSEHQTRDSNTYGPVPLGLIDSRVPLIIWPPDRFGRVKNEVGKAKGRVRKLGEGPKITKIVSMDLE